MSGQRHDDDAVPSAPAPADELARLRAENARLRDELAASRAMHTATIESLPFDFWARDRDGYCTSQNQVTRAHWGDLLDRRPEDMDLPPDVIATWLANNARALAGEVVTGDVTYRVGDETFHMRNILAPIRQGDAIVGTLGVNLDLTQLRRAEAERLRLERRLRETQRLETLGLLAGGVAHDVNNIVMVILATVSLVRRHAKADARLGEDLQTIEIASRRAAALCTQLLAVAGKGQVAREVLDLVALVSETASLVRSTLPVEIGLRIAPPSGVPAGGTLAVEGDPTQLRQLIMNLVLNASEAIDAGGRQGTIAVRVAAVPPDAVAAAQAARDDDDALGAPLDPLRAYVAVEINDNGPGIPPEARAHIFEPFFSTKGRGRGLGLAAALGTVRAHGGALAVTSSPERGTTFRVYLPRAERPQTAPVADPEIASWRGGGLALVVDDDAAVADAAARMVRALGFDVALATSGTAALALQRDHLAVGRTFAVALVDVMMPGLDGPTTLARLRAAQPGLPAALMSGFHDLASPPTDAPLVRKPFTVDELARVLRALALPRDAIV